MFWNETKGGNIVIVSLQDIILFIIVLFSKFQIDLPLTY